MSSKLIKREQANLPMSNKERKQLAKTKKETTELATETAVASTAAPVAEKLVKASELSVDLMTIKMIDVMKKHEAGEPIKSSEWELVDKFSGKLDSMTNSRRKGKDLGLSQAVNAGGGINIVFEGIKEPKPIIEVKEDE